MSHILKGFIAIEGLDGAGTTTQLGILSEKLEQTGRKVFSTFEPTDGEIGRLIRRVLRHEVDIERKALAMLYSADRYEHLYGKGGISEMLSKGYVAISDRYFYSSFAYQMLDADYGFIRSLNPYPAPEHLIFIDPPVDTCLERIAKRSGERELFERRELLTKVRENYLRSFEDLDGDVDFIHVEGVLDIEGTRDRIFAALNL